MSRTPAGAAPGRSGSRMARAAIMRARRRRRARGIAAVALTIALAVAGGVLVLYFLGRDRGPEASAGSTVTAAAERAPQYQVGTLVVVRGEEGAGAFLVVDEGGGGVLLALPAATIVQGPQGFARLNELVEQDQELAAQGVANLLGGRAGRVAEVSWAHLRAAAVDVGRGAGLPDSLVGVEGAEAVLRAAAAVAAAAGSAEGTATLAGLALEGDGADAARAALKALPGSPKVQAVMPGTESGDGPEAYFEPEPAELAVLLGLPADDAGVSIEVQNGSGEVGAAEAVVEFLKPTGLTLLPPRNAEQFPDVALTQILAASDALGQAGRVRDRLGVGSVVEQEGMPAGRIVVVVGKDLNASSLAANAE